MFAEIQEAAQECSVVISDGDWFWILIIAIIIISLLKD